MQHEPVGFDLVPTLVPQAVESVVGERLAHIHHVDQFAGDVHQGHARVHADRVRVRDGARPADVAVRQVKQRARHDAHERTVAVVALAAHAVAGAQGALGGTADVEDRAVGAVFAVVEPRQEAHAHVVFVHGAVAREQRVECGEHERGVVGIRAGGLPVRAAAHHAGAGECAALAELVGHTERVSDRLAVDDGLHEDHGGHDRVFVFGGDVRGVHGAAAPFRACAFHKPS